MAVRLEFTLPVSVLPKQLVPAATVEIAAAPAGPSVTVTGPLVTVTPDSSQVEVGP